MRRHGRGWDRLLEGQKLRYEALAREMMESKEDALAVAREHLVGLIEACRERMRSKQDSPSTTPLRLSACAWTAKDLEIWQGAFEALSTEVATANVRKTIIAPKPPPQATFDQLMALAIPCGEPTPKVRPAWVSMVAQLRQQLRPFGLVFWVPDGPPVIIK
eukprot:10626054-Lingulodinium_polyedra.AAC.1